MAPQYPLPSGSRQAPDLSSARAGAAGAAIGFGERRQPARIDGLTAAHAGAVGPVVESIEGRLDPPEVHQLDVARLVEQPRGADVGGQVLPVGLDLLEQLLLLRER